MSTQLSNVIHAYDESLNKDHSKSYNLSIQLSMDGFSFSIFNTINSKFLSLESAVISHIDHPDEFNNFLKDFVEAHSWLGADFAGINIIFETSRSTLIPAPLYRPEDLEQLARFNFEVTDDLLLRNDRLPGADAYLLYALPGTLNALLQQLFPGNTLKCHASVLIETLMIMNKNLPAIHRMFVNVRNGCLDIVITEGKKLLFYNSFPYRSKQDFIYFIIFVIEQLNLNPEEIPLTLSGAIDKKSTLYDMAWNYVRHIEFQKLSPAFRYSYLFNEIPPHSFFTVLNSGLCE